MAKGFMIEKNMDSAQKFTGVAQVDIDGGTLVAIGDVDDYGRYTVTKQTSGDGKYIALNPSEHYVKIGDVMVAQPTVDPREYTNLVGRSIDLRLLEKGMKIGLTAGNIKASDLATVAKGKYLEAGATGYEVKSSATASTTSLYVEQVVKMPFPQKGIGNEYADVYVCRVAQ